MNTRTSITHRYIHVQGQCVPVKLIVNDRKTWTAFFNDSKGKTVNVEGKTVEIAMKKAKDLFFDGCDVVL